MTITDRLIRRVYKILRIPNSTITFNGSKFHLPRSVNFDFYFSYFKSESWLVELLRIIDQNQDLTSVIDVGANIGQTMLKIKSINIDINYYGFEPNPLCCSMLYRIVKLNSLRNCIIITCGLSNQNTLFPLILDPDQGELDSTASLVEGFRNVKSKNQFTVASYQLDHIISRFQPKKIDVIKIDIEGGELEAIEGMQKTIYKYKPIIIAEVLPSYSSDNKIRINRQKELKNLIKKLNYNIFAIVKSKPNLSFKKLNSFPIHDNPKNCDYIFIHKDINDERLFCIE